MPCSHNLEKTISFIMSAFVFISFLLYKLIIKFMIKKLYPSWMPLKSGIICLKEFNMKPLCIQTIQNYSISWQLVFWINSKLNGHYFCLDSNLSSHIALGANKGNLMCYPIVCTSRLRRESLQATTWCQTQAWTSSTLNIIGNSWWHNLFCQIHEDLKKDPFVIGIQG